MYSNLLITEILLQAVEVHPERVQKFAELFPNGTELTRELCLKHPDVFNLGLPVALLLQRYIREEYVNKVLEIQDAYEIKLTLAKPRGRMIDIQNDESAVEPAKPQRLFTWGPVIPVRVEPPTEQEIEASKEKIARIKREYNLELSLAFFEAYKM